MEKRAITEEAITIPERITITEETINNGVSYALCEVKEKFVDDVYMSA